MKTIKEFQEAINDVVAKFNPYHKPAGPGGGQFTNSLEIRAAEIRKMYGHASIISNTDALEGGRLLSLAQEAEEKWYERFFDELDEEDSIMDHSFYLDVVPIIRQRESATLAALDR